jgi:hypothetical protein
MCLYKALSTARKLKQSKRKIKMKSLRKIPGLAFSRQKKTTTGKARRPKNTPCLVLTINWTRNSPN